MGGSATRGEFKSVSPKGAQIAVAVELGLTVTLDVNTEIHRLYD